MTDIFLRIVNMSISAGWIVLAVLMLRLLLKKAPKWISVVLWGIVAIRLICPFSIESVASLIPSSQTISPEIMVESVPTVNTGIPVINDAVNPIISGSFSPTPGESANPLQVLIPVATGIWLLGIVAMLLYTGISYICLRRKVCTAVLLRDSVYQCETVVSPFVLGTLKPTIYLPFSMDTQDMEHVIAHENAHIRRKDHLWKPFGFLLLALHWFNPLMWLGYVMLCRDIELACDEKVIKKLSGQQKADYSQALLKCSVNRRVIAACPLAFGEVGVKSRVKSVLQYKRPAFWIIIAAILASTAAAVCFLTDPITVFNDNWYSRIQKDRIHTYKLVDVEGASQTTKELIITEKASGEEIQIIRFNENEWFIQEPIYIDISFDGYADIVVPHQRAASGYFYQGYVWDREVGQYVHAPNIQELPNLVLDMENGMVLSHRTASMLTNYGMYKYNAAAEDFAIVRGLSWEPERDGDSVWVRESTYTDAGERETVQQFSAKSTDGLIPDREDPQMSPYYKDDSVWDLGDEKWNTTIAAQSMLFTEETDMLLRVLSSEKTFVSESGNRVYLKNYKLKAKRKYKAVPEKFALVDFDGDGKNELIAYVAPDCDVCMVFRLDGNKVYGYEFEESEITNLKADGSFVQSEGVTTHTYCTLQFSKNKYKIHEMAYFDSSTYKINGEKVTREERYAFLSEFNIKPSVTWVGYQENATADYIVLYESFLAGRITALHNGIGRSCDSYVKSVDPFVEDFMYAYCDMTGDGIPELCIRTTETYIFAVQNGKLHHWHTEKNAHSRPLGNGAFLFEKYGYRPNDVTYEYYVLDANAREIFRVSFSKWEGYTIVEGVNYPYTYYFNEEKVTRFEYDQKTRQYFEAANHKIVWHDQNGNVL